jgi:hypothetical protein
MRNRAIGAGLLLFLLGCNRAGLPAGGEPPKPTDLATPVSQPADLSLPTFDLASGCQLTMPNATTALPGHTLAYAWLGNVDEGGESGCGGPPEGVVILLAEDPTPGSFDKRTSFGLTLPAQLGTQTVTVYTTIGGQRQADATLEITGVTPIGSVPGLEGLQGTIDSPGLGLSGQFSAGHCRDLDVTCI